MGKETVYGSKSYFSGGKKVEGRHILTRIASYDPDSKSVRFIGIPVTFTLPKSLDSELGADTLEEGTPVIAYCEYSEKKTIPLGFETDSNRTAGIPDKLYWRTAPGFSH